MTGSAYPKAEFFFFPTKQTYSFTYEADLKEESLKWKFVRENNPNFSDKEQIWNRLGKTSYVTFSIDGNSCFSMQRYWGDVPYHDGSPRVGTRYLMGYYCFEGHQNLDKDRVEQITKLINVDYSD